MKIHQITFSPTGGTRKVAEHLCGGLGGTTVATELCLKESEVTVPEISADDLAVIAMPVFAGRVPAMAVERLRRIGSSHAKCVVVAVYGNRAYDDALLEMQDVATDMGFRVISAVGAVAEHSIARVYGAGRPDTEDRRVLEQYAAAILKKMEGDGGDGPLALPGNRPYRPLNVGPFPEGDDRCSGCGVCSERCPADAIPADNPRGVNKEACISCMRCIAVCPTKVRGIGQLEAMITERLRPLCSERKDNELFV